MMFVGDPDETGEAPPPEHTDVGNMMFDGESVSGVLMNNSNWLLGTRAGDAVRVPLNATIDWNHAFGGKVARAYSVHALPTLMSANERLQHRSRLRRGDERDAETKLVADEAG